MDDETKQQYVDTNMGRMSIEDYKDIKAMQYGFEVMKICERKDMYQIYDQSSNSKNSSIINQQRT